MNRDRKSLILFTALVSSVYRESLLQDTYVSSVGRKRNRAGESRRNVTKLYYLTVDGEKVPVCQKFFLNTLNVSETACRTVTKKTTSTGTLEKDRRGGRQSEEVIARDKMIKKAVTDHINRFPRVESHFCRYSTSREYLNDDLNIHKMHNMFLKDWGPKPNPPCDKYYEKIFKTMNLSFHSPKKDQCSLCMYVKDSEKDQSIPISDDVRMRFEKHMAEKQMSRQLKQASTERAARNPTTVRCPTFDLQQVIYLPKSNESAIFYKRRLANLNLTFYDINRKSCESFTWHEGVSKRGASEISSCVYQALQLYDQNGVREVDTYSDGCAGQNENSIMPAMMLYTVVNSSSLQEISLRYFESFHGQNEGDSVNSSISTAMKGAGNLFIPSQLIPVFSLSRKNIHVHQLQFQDFIDFKLLSKDLRILDSRKDSDDTDMNWNDIMEVKVTKRHLDTIFYKTSHLDDSYSTIPLKRLKANYLKAYVLNRLNKEPNKISKEKYQDLISLCSGDVPVIRHQEHKDFYFGLPHND